MSGQNQNHKPNKLEKRILDTIRRYRMISSGDRVVAALSGGPDSIFLAFILNKLKERLGIDVFAVHVHHGIRGEFADGDREYCREFCDSLNIPLKVFSRDIPAMARAGGLSLEEAGRKARMKAYREAMEFFGANKTATGHNLNDQAETVLMRLFSGAGKEGLAGIWPVYKGFLIRPILDVKKEEILEYLAQKQVDYRVDHTNFQTEMTRNKIRHLILPVVREQLNPRVDEALARTAGIFREELNYLERVVDFYLDRFAQITPAEARLNLSGVATLNPYILKHLLRKLVLLFKGDLKDITRDHTLNIFNLLEKPSGSSIQIPGKLRVEKEYQYMLIKHDQNPPVIELPPVDIEIPGVNRLEEWGIILQGEVREEAPTYDPQNPFSIFLDYDLCRGKKFVLRTRLAGDRFIPLGMTGSRKIKDFLIDQKVPREKRERIPLLLCGGEIVWVAGIRQSSLYRVTPETKRVLNLRIEKANHEFNDV